MKEGVAITNDCSFAAAWAFDAIRSAQRLLERTEIVAAMTLQALRGFVEAFDERLIATRPHPGAIETAAHLRELVADSRLLTDHGRVIDPYCLRCLPQVHGAIRDAIGYARSAVEIEIASVGDNPLLFVDDGEILSGATSMASHSQSRWTLWLSRWSSCGAITTSNQPPHQSFIRCRAAAAADTRSRRFRDAV